MIFTERTITIRNDSSSINAPVILYRGDKNVEVRFTLVESPYKYSNRDSINIIESTDASYAQLVIKTPNDREPIFGDITAVGQSNVIFVIDYNMIDEIEEVGAYDFQIRLFDADQTSMATIPEVVGGFIIKEPIAKEDTTNNITNSAIVGSAVVTNDVEIPTFAGGSYNKTAWHDGVVISRQKLDKIENGIYETYELSKDNSSQIKEKANKDEVRCDTRISPITLSELHTEVKQAMTGGSVGVVDIDSVGSENIKYKSVNELKTTFLKPGKNLFNKETVTKGKFINSDSGNIGNNENYYLSDYIPVLPVTTYTRVQTGSRLAFYDITKTFISTTRSGTFTTPENCYFIRDSIYISNLEIEQIELGDSKTYYEDYILKCDKLKIYNSNIVNISKDKLDFNAVEKRLGKNLFNPSTITPSSTISPTTGRLSANDYNSVTDYIPIVPNEVYTRTNDTNIAFYDANKKYVSGLNQNNGNKTITIPNNVYYVRMSVPNNSINNFQFELGGVQTKYEPYRYTLVDIYIPPKDSKWKNKKWAVLGDSITGIDYSLPTWNQIISNDKDIELFNYGISGTTMAHKPHTDSSYDESMDRHLFDYAFARLDATEIGYDRIDSSTWETGNCMCERYTKMIDDADLVTVMGGTNDYEIPLGQESDTRTDTLYGGYKHLFEGLIKKYPTSTIAIFTPPQTSEDYETNVMNVDNELDNSDITKPVSLQLRCEVMKRVAKKYGLPVLDLFNISGFNGVGDRASLWYRDGVHPTNLGQEKLASIITEFIETL